MQFYTNVDLVGNRILHRFIDENGDRQTEWADFKPTLYTSTHEENKFKDISGKSLIPMKYHCIKDAKENLKLMGDISNCDIFGDIKWTSLYINDRYFDPIKFNMSKLVVANIDIETEMINFKKLDWGDKKLLTLDVKVDGKHFAFGYKHFTGVLPENAEYIHCDDEDDMILHFLKFWGDVEPNIVTGWNIHGFDIPFLIQRIRNRFGDKTANRLAPTANKFTKRCISEREFEGRMEYTLVGIETLDMMLMYKKFTVKTQESYSLNYIAHVELGEEKIHYSGNLEKLYKDDFNKFILYNIKDVELVDQIDKVRNLMLLVLTLAYMSHIKIGDTFYQLRMWDSIVYNRLMQDNVVVPGNKHSSKTEKYKGAFVNDPVTGFHSWVVAFDLNSLYPHIMEGSNISPEKQITNQIMANRINASTSSEELDALEFLSSGLDRNKLDVNIDDLVAGNISDKLTNALKVANMGMTANGCLWDNNGMGFLGGIMNEQYAQRKAIKKEMLIHESNAELIKEILKSRGV